MKRVDILKKLLPIALLALLPAGSFAKGKIFISRYLKTDYAVITARQSTEENFRIKLVDEEGAELYSSSRIDATTSFQKLFDLNALDNGEYTVEMSSKSTSTTEVFTIEDHKIVKSKKKNKKENTAFFRVSEGKLFISHLNFTNEALRIRIDNGSGEEIYNSNLPHQSIYSGMFDLRKLPAGEYYVSLSAGEKEYNYGFSK